MISWKVKNTQRLLTEIKNKLSGRYTTKDIRWSIDHNRCFVNQTLERFGSTQVKAGDTISISIEKRAIFHLEPGRILFEDDHLLVYDKPPHLASEKLASLTKTHLVHRLDRDTTGVIILAKTESAQKNLEDQFRQRVVVKKYLALVEGNPGESGKIIGKMAPLSKRQGAIIWGISSKGLFSQTDWVRLRVSGKRALLQCTPLTGRTHQIRVHLAHIGHPIVGDGTYGSRSITGVNRPLLHASAITFKHPISNGSVHFEAPTPPDFL